MKRALDYFKQPSTWRGVVGFLAAFGVVLSPEQSQAIITSGVGIIALIEVFRYEKK